MGPLAAVALIASIAAASSQMLDEHMGTLAGARSGMNGRSGDGGPATSALMYSPYALAIAGSSGVTLIADSDNYLVRAVSSSGMMSTYAGNGSGAFLVDFWDLGDGGPALNTSVYPLGASITSNDSVVLLTDESSASVRQIVTATGIITTVAGSRQQGPSAGDGGAATAATFSYIAGLTSWTQDAESGGMITVWVADWDSNNVRTFGFGGTGPVTSVNISLFAGTGNYASDGDGGLAVDASLAAPHDVAHDPSSGALYILEYDAHCVRRVDAAGLISVFVGALRTSGFSGDGGPAVDAQLHYPVGITFDVGPGKLYIADSYNNRIRCVSDGVITTVAGGGLGIGLSIGDGGAATLATLSYPKAVAINPYTQSMVIAESATNRIRFTYPWGLAVESASNTNTSTGAPGGGAAVYIAWASVYETALDNTAMAVAGVGAGCLWDNGVAAAPADQAAAANFSFRLHMTGGVPPALNGTLPVLPCSSVSVVRPPILSPTPTCERVAHVTCTVSPAVDGGTGWALELVQPNGTAADPSSMRLQLLQRAGATVSAPLALTSVAVVVAPAAVGGVGACGSGAGAASAGASGCNVTLTLDGSNFGTHPLLVGGGALTVQWAAGAGCQAPVLYGIAGAGNGAIAGLTVTCSAAADPAALFWTPKLLTMQVGNSVASILVPLTVGLPAVQVTPALARWGDTITITSPGLGTALPAAINVTLGSGAPDALAPLACLHVAAAGPDQVQCQLRFVAAAWVGQPLALVLAFLPQPGVGAFGQGFSFVAIPTAIANLTLAQPTFVAATAPAWVAGTQGAVLQLVLPQGQWQLTEIISAGLSADTSMLFSLRGWTAGGVRLGVCAYVDAMSVQCIASAGAVLAGALVVEVGGLINVTAVSMLLVAPAVVTPAAFTWGDVLTISGPGLGSLGASLAVVSIIPSNASVFAAAALQQQGAMPCSNAARVDADTLRCTLRIAMSALAGQALGLQLTLSGAGDPYILAPTPMLGASFEAPAPLNVSVDAWSLPTASGGDSATVCMWLPQPRWTDAEVAAAGMADSAAVFAGVRGWVGSVPMTCSFNASIADGAGNVTACAGAGFSSPSAVSDTVVLCITGAGTTLGLPIVIEAGGALNLTATATIVAVPATVSTLEHGAQAEWGDSLVLASAGIGQRTLAGIYIAAAPPSTASDAAAVLQLARGTNSSATSALPCIAAVAIDANTLSCRLRFVSDAWTSPTSGAGNGTAAANSTASANSSVPQPRGPAFVSVLFAGAPLVHVLALDTTAVFVPPTFTALDTAPAGTLLSRTGGTLVNLTLPQLAWTAAEALAQGILPAAATGMAGVRAWLQLQTEAAPDVFAPMTACAVDASWPLSVTCAAPAGSAASGAFPVLELGGLTNVTLSSSVAPASSGLGYAAPSVLAAVPRRVLLPTAAQFDAAGAVSDVVLLGTGGFANDFSLLAGLTICGLPCAPLALINDTALLCQRWNASACMQAMVASAGAAALLPPAVAIDVAFQWVDTTQTTSGLVTGSVRPMLSHVVPAAAQAGAVLVLYGTDLWPSDTGALASLAPAVTVGGVPCTSVTANSVNVLTCIAPMVPVATPGYPTLWLTVTHALGGASVELVSVAYPTTPFAVPLVTLPRVFIPSDASAPWPIAPSLAFTVLDATDGNATASAPLVFSCSLGTESALSQVTPLTLSTLMDVPQGDGHALHPLAVDFRDVAITSSFALPNVTLSVSCSYYNAAAGPSGAGSGNTPQFTWTLATVPLYALPCAGLPPDVQSQQTLPAFAVAMLSSPPPPTTTALPSGGAANECEVMLANQAATAAGMPLDLPAISCALSAKQVGGGGSAATNGPAGGSVFVTGGTASVVDASALTFESVLAQMGVAAGGAALPVVAGMANFTGLSVAGAQNATYTLMLRCTVGAVPVPPSPLQFTVTISGCAPGTQPVGVVCAQCAESEFSLGGTTPCQACPAQGAACHGGLLTPLEGYYRPPSQAGLPLSAASVLLPCPMPGACVLVNGSQSCATGFTGPLCAVCDARDDYAMFGETCGRCWAPAASRAVVVPLLLLMLLAILGYAIHAASRSSAAARPPLSASATAAASPSPSSPAAAASPPPMPPMLAAKVAPPPYRAARLSRRSSPDTSMVSVAVAGTGGGVHSAASPTGSGGGGDPEAVPPATGRASSGCTKASSVLRVLLAFVQAVGSLRAFKSSGLAVYDAAMDWTDVVAASPMSLGPALCLWRFDYLQQFLAILLLPPLASACVMLVSVAVRAARSVRMRWPSSQSAVAAEGRDAAAPRVAASSAAPRRCAWLPCMPAARQGCTQLAQLLRCPLLRVSFDYAAFSEQMRELRSSRSATAALLFVLQLAYMPVVSAAIRALDCTSPIDGVSYLRVDMTIACDRGAQHLALQALAALTLIGFGVGFPLAVFLRLRRTTRLQLDDTGFRAAWGFLYAGYRLPKPLPAAQHVPGGTGVVARARMLLQQSTRWLMVSSRSISSGSGSSSTPDSSAAATSPRLGPPDVVSSLVSPSNGKHHRASSASSPFSAAFGNAAASDNAFAASGGTSRCPTSAGLRLRIWMHCRLDRWRMPEHMAWWEAVVLVRKAGIVLFSLLVSDLQMQVLGAVLWMLTFLGLHMVMRPYTSRVLNLLELVTLGTIVVTAVMSAALVTTDATGASGDDSHRNTIITIVLVILNAAVTAVLASYWLWLLMRHLCTRLRAQRDKDKRPGGAQSGGTHVAAAARLSKPRRSGGAMGRQSCAREGGAERGIQLSLAASSPQSADECGRLRVGADRGVAGAAVEPSLDQDAAGGRRLVAPRVSHCPSGVAGNRETATAGSCGAGGAQASDGLAGRRSGAEPFQWGRKGTVHQLLRERRASQLGLGLELEMGALHSVAAVDRGVAAAACARADPVGPTPAGNGHEWVQSGSSASTPGGGGSGRRGRGREQARCVVNPLARLVVASPAPTAIADAAAVPALAAHVGVAAHASVAASAIASLQRSTAAGASVGPPPPLRPSADGRGGSSATVSSTRLPRPSRSSGFAAGFHA